MFQINSKSSLRAALLLGAASAAVIGFSAPASADQIETVVVTGSLIPTPNATSNSPIQTVSAESIDLSGHPDVSQVLNTLPQIVPSLGAFSNNPGGGETTVNLRGLSPIRTLVLVDGRRVLPASVTGEVDISQIPAALIDHVDVVTGGGSATYGSDAIAGVVNFVLKKDFEGFQAQARYGQEVTHSFVPEKELNFTMGVNSADGKANITLFGEFYKRSGMLQGEDSKFKLDNFFGSATAPAGRVDGGQGFAGLATGSPANCGATSDTYAFDTAGNPQGFCNLLAPTSDPKANALASQFETLDPQGDRYNFAPVNELVTPETRHTVHAIGHYDIFPGIEAYASLHYSNSVNITQLAATPVTDGAALHFVVTPNPAAVGVGSQPTFLGAPNPFFGVPGFTSFISPAFQALIDTRATTLNPNTGLPFGYSPFVVRWRSLAVGNRQDTFTTNAYEMTGGLKGQLPFVNGWDWDAYYQWGSGDQTSVAEHNVSASHLGQAMLSCPVGSGKGCVPIDIFGEGNLTPEMASFVDATTVDSTHYDRQLAHFETHGNVGDYWGEGAITAAFGAEWRRDSATFRPDQAKQNFDILGFNPARTSQGSYNVWELFTEFRVPLISDMPWVEYLGFDGGARFSRYSGAGDATTWKAGLEYQPTDDIRFRGMWQRALRAPNINELFNGGSDGFPAVTDPCDAPTSGAVAAACTAQFAAVGLAYNPATFQQSNPQSETVTFGNPSLSPETSNTFTVGAVVTPTFLPDVTASIDFWRISVKNFISVVDGGSQTLINDCINNFGGVGTRPFQELNPSFGNVCDLVTRTGTGDLLFSIPNANVTTGGPLKTSGLDLQLNAQHDLADLLGQDGDWGAVDGSFAINWLTEFFDPSCPCSLKGEVDFFGAAAGFNVSPRPNYKFTTRLGYTYGDWRAVLTWNEIGAVRDDFGFGDVIRPYDKVDLAIRWNITDQYAADLIIDNLFNVNPPLGPYSGLGSINTIVETYDPLGTQAFIGLTAKL